MTPWDISQLISVRGAYTSNPRAFPYKKPAGDILTTSLCGHPVRWYVDKKGVRCANAADLAAFFNCSLDFILDDAVKNQIESGPCASHAICRAGNTTDDLYLADPYLKNLIDSFLYGVYMGAWMNKAGLGKQAYALGQYIHQHYIY